MIAKFFSWWGRELAGALPPSWTRSPDQDASVLSVSLTADRIVYAHRSGSDLETLGELPRSSHPGAAAPAASTSARESLHAVLRALKPEKTRCEVTLDDSSKLRKTVSLPLAAEENLSQVLAFEMERHTPFHVDDVYFDYRVLTRDVKTRRLSVELLVARKATVDEALSVIKEWDLQSAPGAAGDTASLAFLPRAYRAPSTRSVNRMLLALNVAALAAVLLIPIYQQEAYLDDLRARVDRARTRAVAAIEVQDKIESLRQERALLADAKSGRRSTVELVEELTRLLPDGTWLNRLEIRNNEVHFQGFSETASALVGVVEASELFRDARFGSPITRDVRTGRERFHVSAKLAPPKQELASSKADAEES